MVINISQKIISTIRVASFFEKDSVVEPDPDCKIPWPSFDWLEIKAGQIWITLKLRDSLSGP
jgi:hypothetical protein